MNETTGELVRIIDVAGSFVTKEDVDDARLSSTDIDTIIEEYRRIK